jgi:type II secretory pathway pseudopilin PulG
MNQPSEPSHPGNPDQQPYSSAPPPEEEKSAWAIGCGGLEVFTGLVILGLLMLAAIPLFTPSTRDARLVEGEYMMSSLRISALAAYEKMGTPPRTLTGSLEEGGAEVEPPMLLGQYYHAEDRIGAPQQGYGKLTANPTPDHSRKRTGTMTFSWDTSVTEIEWKR